MKDKKQKAYLIDLVHPRTDTKQALERMDELEELVGTYGGIVVVKTYQKRLKPHPRTFVGTGKVEEIAEEGKGLGASLLIVNDVLKPRQAYAISEVLRPSNMQVWDRADLILKIFAKHARTTEAKLEIELAAIKHMGPRIFGMGMELSRQGGGIGTLGAGETNTEMMKRHLRKKQEKIKEKLEKYAKVRAGHRKNRKRNQLKTVALVGYTNAGKTTLLNKLTGRKEYAADALFATLDTRVGSLYLPEKQSNVLVSDTIGFIKNLPPELLNAFASTLSEAVDADVLLQVLDASDKNAMQHLEVVEEILERLKIHKTPRILVCNKMELMRAKDRKKFEKLLDEDKTIVWVSAATGEGVEDLVSVITKLV